MAAFFALSSFAQHRLEGIPLPRCPTSPVRCRFDDNASNIQTQALILPVVKATHLLDVPVPPSACWHSSFPCAPPYSPRGHVSPPADFGVLASSCSSPLRPLLIAFFTRTIQANIYLDFLAHLHIVAMHVLDKEHLKRQIFNMLDLLTVPSPTVAVVHAKLV